MKALYRFLIDWYQASDRPLPAWLDRACQRDEELAREYEVGQSLTDQLRNHPREPRLERSPGLTGRILGELESDRIQAEIRRPHRARWIGALAVVASLALIVARFSPDGSAPDGTEIAVNPAIPAAAATVEAKAALREIESLSKDWVNPLDQEMDYMIADARNALDFLKTSFVPSSYLNRRNPAAPEETQS